MAALPIMLWAQGPICNHYEFYTNGMSTNYQLCKVGNVYPGSTGLAHVWDFSTMTDSTGPGTTFTTTARDASHGAPYQGTWPNSNFSTRSGGTNVHYNYINQVSGGSSYLVGTVDSSAAGVYKAYFEPDSLLYAYNNMNVNQNASDSCLRHYTISTYNCGKGRDSLLCDGWGTLKLPHGIIHDSVIRVKSVQYFKDTIGCAGNNFSISTVTSYAWYDTAHSMCLMRIDSIVNYLGIASLTYKNVQYSTLGTGINELSMPQVNANIYPNPNNGNFTLNYYLTTPKAVLYVRDVTGRLVYSQNVNGMSGKETIDVSSLNAGIYYWELSAANEISANGKLSVIK